MNEYQGAADRRDAGMQDTSDEPIQDGYILTDDGQLYLQLPARNCWGFVIASDDQTWDGGVTSGIRGWELLDDTDPRITADVRDTLQWLRDDWMTDFRNEQEEE